MGIAWVDKSQGHVGMQMPLWFGTKLSIHTYEFGHNVQTRSERFFHHALICRSPHHAPGIHHTNAIFNQKKAKEKMLKMPC